ncbi:MAG: hypothetical protein HS122_03350 [Opitutaceae bacterium]|nr:hypothetical protein [Opitutaceae bacterium]
MATPSAQGGAIPAGKINIGYPDISSLHPDLESPEISEDEPAAGRRVRTTLPKWRGTSVYFSLYLPIDWKHGHTFPVIVEYPGNGNYRSKHGDICTGRVEDCNLGFGISGGKGSIWICLPFVDETKHENALQWWGNVDVTVAFCKEAVAYICSKYGGDPTAVFLCGFSRGAIACNFIGLHDEEIAGIWRGFFAASHYDGARAWPYAGSDRAAARERLERLGNRRVFVSHEVYDVTPETYTIVDTINYLAGTGRSLSTFGFNLCPFVIIPIAGFCMIFQPATIFVYGFMRLLQPNHKCNCLVPFHAVKSRWHEGPSNTIHSSDMLSNRKLLKEACGRVSIALIDAQV